MCFRLQTTDVGLQGCGHHCASLSQFWSLLSFISLSHATHTLSPPPPPPPLPQRCPASEEGEFRAACSVPSTPFTNFQDICPGRRCCFCLVDIYHSPPRRLCHSHHSSFRHQNGNNRAVLVCHLSYGLAIAHTQLHILHACTLHNQIWTVVGLKCPQMSGWH